MTQANLTLQKKETKDTRFLWACILDRTLSACFASLTVGLHDCSCTSSPMSLTTMHPLTTVCASSLKTSKHREKRSTLASRGSTRAWEGGSESRRDDAYYKLRIVPKLLHQ